MIEFLQWIGGIGGVGAIFAVLIFWVYKNQCKTMRDDRKYFEGRLQDLIKEYNKTIQDNTRVTAELYTYLKARNHS